MNLRPFVAVLLLVFVGCKSGQRKSYAIRDFREDLQPYLLKAINSGVVGDENSGNVQKNATEDELKQLSQSELPLLRATAFREMLRKPGFNLFEIVISHLDDTAMIEVDAGEWGTRHSTVADDLISNVEWKDSSERQKAIDSILINHNYLRSAYSYRMLPWLKPEEKYYASIRKMTEREEWWFEDIEQALFALAKYKKQSDIPFIKEKLMSNMWRISATSLWLMREYPDEAYIEVLRRYYKSRFYRLLLEMSANSDPASFLQTVASYKSKQSAALLDSILNKRPFVPIDIARYYALDTNSIKKELAYDIWDNPCKAYDNLRIRVKGRIKQYEKDKIEMPIESFADTTSVPIRW